MRDYWSLSIILSLTLHAGVFLIASKTFIENHTVETKKRGKEIEIIPQTIKNFKETWPKKNIDHILEKGGTPPPYIDNLARKVLFDKNKKITLDKPLVLDKNLRKIVLSELPKEKELKENPAYMDYYHLIREKIRANAYRYYELDDAGEVSLTFVISRNGKLDAVYLNEESMDDKDLIGIALKSIQKAAPFPPFPNELNYPKLQFNISIYFKSN